MTAVFKSKSGKIYDYADLALCDDAQHADFQMFTQTGEACNDVELCYFVWCPTAESIAQFDELRLSANRFLNCHFHGAISEGLNRYDDCAHDWFLVGTPSATADMSATILKNIAHMKKEGKWS